MGDDGCYRHQEQEAGTRTDGLTSLGFLLLSSLPVTHLPTQETSLTSTFLAALWGPCSGGVHSIIKPGKIKEIIPN